MTTWYVKQHAAQRYCERYDPSLTDDEALTLLREHCGSAVLMPARTRLGQEQWLLSELSVVAVVKKDPDGTHVVVTVLPVAEECVARRRRWVDKGRRRKRHGTART